MVKVKDAVVKTKKSKKAKVEPVPTFETYDRTEMKENSKPKTEKPKDHSLAWMAGLLIADALAGIAGVVIGSTIVPVVSVIGGVILGITTIFVATKK